jgi:hypothetical protein
MIVSFDQLSYILKIGYFVMRNDLKLLHSSIRTYKSSTFFLAQGVLRKKVKLDFILGSILKQLTLIIWPNSSHPYSSTNSFKIISSVFPCSGLLACVDMSILNNTFIYNWPTNKFNRYINFYPRFATTIFR